MNQTQPPKPNQKKGINSRQLDNHFDSKVHTKAWIAPGLFPKLKNTTFQHNDCGLGVVSKKLPKFKNFKERFEIEEEVNELTKKSAHFRNFKEFDNLSDGDLIITIEYCSNCQIHESSTRHQEGKYYSNAVILKQEILANFPNAKIYLKPLIYEPNNNSHENLYLMRRIGAFEVQVASKRKDEEKKGTVFSKLESKTWPSFDQVLQNISIYLPSINLQVLVQHDGEKIRGMNVILQPYRKPQQQKLNTNQTNKSINENSRPQSSNSRPFSAASSVQNLNRAQSAVKIQKPKEFTQTTNVSGIANFQGIPVDNYTVSIAENNEYQGFTKLINLYELQYSNNPSIEINLQKSQYGYAKFIVFNEEEGRLKDVKIEIQADNGEKTFVNENPKGSLKYEIVLVPGQYHVVIRKRFYDIYDDKINVVNGTNEIKIELKKNDQNAFEEPQQQNENLSNKENKKAELPPQKQAPANQKKQTAPEIQKETPSQNVNQLQQQRPQVQEQKPQEQAAQQQKQQIYRPTSGAKQILILLYDPITQNPLENVSITLQEESIKATHTFKTNAEGVAVIPLNNILEGKLIISQPDYFEIIEDYGIGNNKVNFLQFRELQYPLIRKPQNDDQLQILIQFDIDDIPLNPILISPQNTLIIENNEFVNLEFNVENGWMLMTISKVKQQKGYYRLFAEILDPENFHPSHIKLYLINKNKHKIIEIPKIQLDDNPENAKFWDIAQISLPNGEFLEINAVTESEITLIKCIPEYEALLKIVNNSKSVDLKTLLGFNGNERLEIQNDILVQKNKINQSLDKYGYEFPEALDYLLMSAQNVNGMISFKKLEQKFSSIQFSFQNIEIKQTPDTIYENEEDGYEPYDENEN